MAKLLKLRRGTNTQHSTFTGAEGEVTVNTTNDTLHVHDGSTAGGHELARADLSNVDNTTIVNGTSNVSVSQNADTQVVNAGTQVALFQSDGPRFNDNIKAKFGSGSDLAIYHDGANSYIEDVATGDLILKSSSTFVRDGSNNAMLNCNAGGSVQAFHNGSQKLATTSTGIDVTGSVTCDGLTSDGDITLQSGNGILYIKDTDNDGVAAQQRLIGSDSNNNIDWYVGQAGTGNNNFYVSNNNSASLIFRTAATERAYFQDSGHFVPWTNNTYDLGSSGLQWRNAYFDGTVNCDGLTSDGDVTIRSGFGTLNLQDTDNTVAGAQTQIVYRDSAGTIQGKIGYLANNNQDLYIANELAAPLVFTTNGTSRALVDSNGHFLPTNNNTYDLGSSSNRWRNVYTNDLNLSNEGGTNDVDGTWGSWTIQEGEDDLFLLNRRNGKKYKFNLSEVN